MLVRLQVSANESKSKTPYRNVSESHSVRESTSFKSVGSQSPSTSWFARVSESLASGDRNKNA